MTSLLQTLGDDWHIPHPYMRLIHSVLPSTDIEEATAIERMLLHVYEDEHYDFKNVKQQKPIQTLFECEIEIATTKKKHLDEDLKKEDDRFTKLMDKFKELGMPDGAQEEDGEDKEPKAKNACGRTSKAEEIRKANLVHGIKASMATSQARVLELTHDIEELTRLCKYYVHYDNATKVYLRSMKQLTLSYADTKDLPTLIKGLQSTLSYYEDMMRRYVSMDSCTGDGKGLCETHLLPLRDTVHSKDNYRHVWRCCVSP